MQLMKRPRNSKKYREMIADLDWWSKYYVTKEDNAQVRPASSEKYGDATRQKVLFWCTVAAMRNLLTCHPYMQQTNNEFRILC